MLYTNKKACISCVSTGLSGLVHGVIRETERQRDRETERQRDECVCIYIHIRGEDGRKGLVVFALKVEHDVVDGPLEICLFSINHQTDLHMDGGLSRLSGLSGLSGLFGYISCISVITHTNLDMYM